MSGVYLYGIVEGKDLPAFVSSEIVGASPVFTVAHEGISCVVSDYGGERLSGLTKERLIQSLLAHQKVIERVMPGCAVLPVKFGTVLANLEEVQEMLSQGHRDFVGALEANRGRLEMEVAATWDTNKVLQEIGAEEEVAEARRAITASGQPTVEEQVRLGKMVKSCMDRRRESYRERIVSHLEFLSVDLASNALVSDQFVVNVAFLVNQDQQREFEEGVQQLDQLFYGEINFRIIGPLPPYSFSAVEITRLNGAQVEEAQHTLDLKDGFSPVEVRRAYRKLAAREHRALQAGDQTAGDRFLELRRATHLLLGSLGSRGKLARITGQPVFLIKIKRSAGEDLPHAPSPVSARRLADV